MEYQDCRSEIMTGYHVAGVLILDKIKIEAELGGSDPRDSQAGLVVARHRRSESSNKRMAGQPNHNAVHRLKCAAESMAAIRRGGHPTAISIRRRCRPHLMLKENLYAKQIASNHTRRLYSGSVMMTRPRGK
jgi:hypothetical protein